MILPVLYNRGMEKNILITRRELESLENKSYPIDETIEFPDIWFDHNSRIRAIHNCHIHGSIIPLHGSSYFEFHWSLQATLICPCAITNEDVVVPLDCEDEELLSFEPSDDDQVLVLTNDTFDLTTYTYERISLEAPLSVVKPGEIKYPSGVGWRIISESKYEATKDHTIDPRLAKLKDFKFEDE